ncbi:MAG: DUF3574 domain-containing protein [Scytolyngbya sp. HA4215-MV1]|jgi:hypothetical protein|nr:DUF3574 domain-containing protein [Scytolyngbya sp. HA4215-MV1]
MKPLNCLLPSVLVLGVLLTKAPDRAFADEAQPQPQPMPTLPCQVGTFTKAELYFGLAKPTGRSITELEWQQFLNQTVTPRFRGGLSVVNARGQYLDRSGRLVIEPSKVLILLYKSSAEKERAIADIVTTYKQTFQQESVLKISACVQVAF